ncbi:hypothetical protein BW723_08330 [Polaribacter reichenbachii]|uniref:Uncharacterized protein n=1 Tax=Polaribacter reichenbachii TaxID=996801 RepID=A0A1B8U6S1_9FLAO|nr:hypothetical protein [Polaribacter reichenbachii]APZ46304.1 hypothetical protein BW723_08330 [Polaribacter reichenbachii]AUC20167.1 hypothetical protein BTO17_16350 [Polaribacter reichenbachii]OBY67574.1 hypothetical protein LPB301_01160 [Polaribacter reichenbachii]
MSLLATKSSLYATFKSLGLLYLFIAYGLFLDGFYIYNITDNAQLYANISMLLVFPIIYFKVNKRSKEHLIAGVLIGFFGEYLFSVLLGMYTYRLENVPHYIPFGHALVYLAVLYFSKAASIIKHRKKIEVFLAIFIFIYASVFLIFKFDVFGFVMTMATLYILRNKPRERLFYLTMYVSVAYLEIIGTSLLCWEWPPIAWDVIPFLPSHNPPSGISLFYFLLDLGCLWVYKKRHKISWLRMKSIRKIREHKTVVTN